MKSKSFTLIEFLIVIARISILAALLFPALQSSKRKALVSFCLFNQKSLSQAGLMYVGDFDDCMPVRRYGLNQQGASGWSWCYVLNALYVKSAKAFLCGENQTRNITLSFGGSIRSYVGNYAFFATEGSITDTSVTFSSPQPKISKFRHSIIMFLCVNNTAMNYTSDFGGSNLILLSWRNNQEMGCDYAHCGPFGNRSAHSMPTGMSTRTARL